MNNHRHADHGCNRCSSTMIRMVPSLGRYASTQSAAGAATPDVLLLCNASASRIWQRETSITGHGHALTTVRRAPAMSLYFAMSNVPTFHFPRQPDHVGAMCVYRVHHVPVAEELSYHLEARSHGSWYLLGRCLAASSLCHFSLPMARGLRGKSRYMSKPEVKAAADSLRGLQSLRWCVMCGMCLQGVCLCVDSPTLSLFVHVHSTCKPRRCLTASSLFSPFYNAALISEL